MGVCPAEQAELEAQLLAANTQINSLVEHTNEYQKCTDPTEAATRTAVAALAQKEQAAYIRQAKEAALQQDVVTAEQQLLQRSRSEHVAKQLDGALTAIGDANSAKIAGLNSDIMTAKRLGTIHSQNLIHTRNTSDYLKIVIVFLCFSVLV